eukprot:CAMPEP_0197866686 /NCGR_PEP_ID=MMETSP1438-20131217/44350_1 /TAXON_ID=1461541 /ORGANISM="Pterosperma sp., Strain CCMP1384" /LENGTH=419 /DNA_ID=CAMNT_0043485273 /DNA_START=128 /DNA_END=1384 /DNA_ORIENTATION=-
MYKRFGFLFAATVFVSLLRFNVECTSVTELEGTRAGEDKLEFTGAASHSERRLLAQDEEDEEEEGEDEEQTSNGLTLLDRHRDGLAELGYREEQIEQLSSMSMVSSLRKAEKMALDKLQTLEAENGRGQAADDVSDGVVEEKEVAGEEEEEQQEEEADNLPHLEGPAPAANFTKPKPNLNPETLKSLTPPDYCFTAVNGEKAFPTVGKMKSPPSDKVAQRIAKLLLQERPCWIFTKKCALDPNSKDLKGRPYFTKYAKGGKDPIENWIQNLPDMGPGALGTCAIVGTADNLVGKKWGKQIDAHDFVVRFNTVLKGYGDDVGSRVDGLWTKDGYATKDTASISPKKYHMIPKVVPPNCGKLKGKPVMAYGPAINDWRPVAKEVYDIYKKEKKITRGTPTGGLARQMSMVESGLCTRVDIY